jgi:hypothetical protein
MLMVMSLFSLSTCEMPRMYPFTDTANNKYFCAVVRFNVIDDIFPVLLHNDAA